MAQIRLPFIRNAAAEGYTGDPMPNLLNGGTHSNTLYKIGGTVYQVAQDSFWCDISQVRNLDIATINSVKFCFSAYKNKTATSRSYGYIEYAAKVSGVNGMKVAYTASEHFPTSKKAYSCSLGSWTKDELCNSAGIHIYIKSHIRPFSVSVTTHISDCYVEIDYTLKSYTVTVNAGTGGTVSGGGTFTSGTSTTLKAIPNEGYRFVKWSDGNTSATRTVTVTNNATYTAYFEFNKKLYIGTQKAESVYIGATPVKSIYIGTKRIF